MTASFVIGTAQATSKQAVLHLLLELRFVDSSDHRNTLINYV